MKHRVICRYGHTYFLPLGDCYPAMNFQRKSGKQQLVGVSKTGGISLKIMKNIKTDKVSIIPENNNLFPCLLFFRILVPLQIFMFFSLFFN